MHKKEFSFLAVLEKEAVHKVEAQLGDPIQKPVMSGLEKLPSQREILSKAIEFSKRTLSIVHRPEKMGGPYTLTVPPWWGIQLCQDGNGTTRS